MRRLRRILGTGALTWLTTLGAIGAARAEEANWGLKVTGLAGWPTAGADDRSARATIEPSVKWKLAGLELHARERVRWLDLQGGERTDSDVRDLTLGWRSGDLAVKLGAQQVNWGRMDILRVTDVINPVDQHDLFYEELPEAKLALWMANLEWQDGSQTIQILASPQVPLDRYPDRVSDLSVRVTKPDVSLRNTTFAARYGFEALGWNADLTAVRGWQSSPALRPVVDESGISLLAAMSRQTSIGFSADKPIGSTVLRVEGLYARLTPTSQAAMLGFAKRQQASLGAGLDVRSGPWFFAGQALFQHDRDNVSGSGETAFLSAIVQRKWLQDRLSARALYIHETRTDSSWTSLQASYELSPNQLVQVQGDWFNGNTVEAFGSLEQRSRIAASLRLEF